MMKILRVEHGSSLYQAAVFLRNEVLRRPLGLAFSPEQLAAEVGSIHLSAYDEHTLLGCLNLLPLPDGEIKMRSVAVRPDLQRAGVGTALIKHSELLATQEGFRRMMLHARETAVPFYQRLGYVIEGERFEQVTLPHFKMYKIL
jgi:GNAT superfamily N-acetyltransferase